MGIKSGLLGIYDKHYKILMIITVLLLFLAMGVLGYQYMTTGEFVQKGVSLKGGITLTIPVKENIDIKHLETSISSQLLKSDVAIRTLTESGVITEAILEVTDVDEETLLDTVKKAGLEVNEGEYTIESMGSSLGESFFRQTVMAVLIAFIAMGLVVFITFRQVVPSLFVILAASSDIICTLAVISLLGIKLSTAGVAAFLMLIGYSVDTDILLTARVLKRKEGTVFDRILTAMKTGMTMSMTSFCAALLALIFTQSEVIKQIMLIIVIGLLFDMLNTWIQNTGILRWHLERKQKKAEQNN